jgi:hypothetical protein
MEPTISAETELERALLADPRLRAGLGWGAPREGHPEGTVAQHVAAILARIPSDDPLRADLRFLAVVHDSFKRDVRPHERWSPDNDHATLARRFAERHTSDERVLAALELHDEPYWIWRNGGAARERYSRCWGDSPVPNCSRGSSNSTPPPTARTSPSCGGFDASWP